MLPACKRKAAQAPAPAAAGPGPTVLLLPSAGAADEGQLARGCARLMARQIDRATRRDAAMVALIVGVAPDRIGFVTPSSPLPLDQAFAAARGHGASMFA